MTVISTTQNAQAAVPTTPAVPAKTPGVQLGMPGWSLDVPQGIIYAGGTPVKLIPAIVSTLAIKLIFFGGNLASTKAKALLARKKASRGGEVAPNLVTNPRRRRRR